MAQETATVVKDQHLQHDHIDDDEVSELQHPGRLYQKVREQMELFASTRLGQFAIERADRGLQLIEDTTKWSLPQEKNGNNVVLERPLPWVPFLLLIIALRLARIWVSLGALVIGNEPVSPSDMIYFIQTRRRKLRAIRVHGLRMMRHRQQEPSSQVSRGYTQQLSQWVSRAICRPGVQRANSGRIFNVRALDTQQQSIQLNQSVSKRPRDEEPNADLNLTIDEMLTKYANDNSEDDSDFVPNALDDNTTSSASSSDSDSHTSEEISSNEDEDIVEHLTNVSRANQNHVEKEQEMTEKTATLNGSSGGNDKEQTNVAAPHMTEILQEEQWKSSPGHVSAALMNTSLYNNAAAAGSPNNYNADFANLSLLGNVTIATASSYSTPNSELDEIHSPGSELEEATIQCISLAHQVEHEETTPVPKPSMPQQQQQQQQQQHQQRRFNHSHQRFRGRNRR